MRRFKSNLSPYVSDVVAFALLGASLASILAVATASGKVDAASITYAVTNSYTTSL